MLASLISVAAVAALAATPTDPPPPFRSTIWAAENVDTGAEAAQIAE